MTDYRWTEQDIANVRARVRPAGGQSLGLGTAPVPRLTDAPATALPKQSKYRNMRCEWNGERFDSKRELDCYLGLLALENARRISGLDRQVRYPLHVAGTIESEDPIAPPIIYKIHACDYIADFIWFDDQSRKHVADAKSDAVRRNRISQLKLKWMNLEYGITVELL